MERGSGISMKMEENRTYTIKKTALLYSIHVFSVFVLNGLRFGIRVI
jgi:hypothetical protein